MMKDTINMEGNNALAKLINGQLSIDNRLATLNTHLTFLIRLYIYSDLHMEWC